jgi:2-deoxy-D-gluconate 3-dehydrogenase
MIDLRLDDSVIIVTGASRGLGAAIARSLAAEGARVVAAARTTRALDEVAADRPDRIHVAACEMRDRDAVASLVDTAVDRFGRVDGVVNNAGIAPAGGLVDTDLSVMEETLAVNVLGPAALAQAAARHLISEGRPGSIVNIASTSGLKGKALLSGYSASKGALMRLTEALAAEWARHRIRVNTIAPGAFETEAQAAVLEDEKILAARLRKIPARRMGRPDEIGPLVCYLISPLSDYVTGSCFVIDGGEVAKL